MSGNYRGIDYGLRNRIDSYLLSSQPVTGGKCDQMKELKVAQIYTKVDPKSSQSSVYFKVMSFSKAQIVTKYLGYFCKKICYQEFSKIAPIWSHCLDSTKQINMLLFNITKAAESKQEKQDVSCTVIFPPMK